MSQMILVPDYYEQFQCLGADCKYTCCQTWDITLTKQDYTRMRKIKFPKEIQQKIDESLKRYKKDTSDELYAQIACNKDGFCPLLKDGLCSLQIECGFGVLSHICKAFPRMQNILPSPATGLSTACEKVVLLLMDKHDSIRFHNIASTANELPSDLNELYIGAIEENPMLAYHVEIRRLCIDILQNRSYSLDNRMILLGIAMRGLDELVNAKNYDAIPAFIEQKSLLKSGNQMAQSLDKLPANSQLCVANNISSVLRVPQNGHLQLCQMRDKVFENLGVIIENDEATYSITKYENAMAYFNSQNYDVLFENIMVNNFFAFNYPFAGGTIWETYMFLCYFYSFMKFMVAGAVNENTTKDELVRLLVLCSRFTFHGIRMEAARELSQNEMSTLGHMVIMIKG